MKVLWIAPYTTDPPLHGGKLRLAALTRQCINAGHEVEIIGAQRPVRSMHRPGRRIGWHLVNRALQTISCWPEAGWLTIDRNLMALVREKARNADVVVFEQSHVAPYLPDIGTTPLIYDSQNFELGVTEQLRDASRGIARIRLTLDAHKVGHAERTVLRRAAALCVVSQQDLHRYSSWYSGTLPPTYVIPNGVHASAIEWSPPRMESATRLVMTGTLGYLPNLDGLQWFLGEIWPTIRSEIPEATFKVVGSSPPTDLRKAVAQAPGTAIEADVADIGPHLRGSDLFVAPLRIGGGSRLKVFEAAAFGLPIVGTSLALEGTEFCERGLALSADNPEEFAQACIALLQDHERRLHLSEAGRRWVSSEYDWQHIGQALLVAINATITAPTVVPHQ